MKFSIKVCATLVAALLVGTAMAADGASDCPADFDFVAPQGHEGRAKAMAGLGDLFKAAEAKDKEAFITTDADPYIQHSPDLADGIEPVWDLENGLFNQLPKNNKNGQ